MRSADIKGQFKSVQKKLKQQVPQIRPDPSLHEAHAGASREDRGTLNVLTRMPLLRDNNKEIGITSSRTSFRTGSG